MSLSENAPTGYHAKLHDAIHENMEITSSPDPYGPRPVSEMTDRELLEETVTNMRMVGAALTAFQEMGPGKMMASLFSARK